VCLFAADVAHDQRRKHRGGDLRHEIGAELVCGHPLAEEHGGAHRRIEVAARHVTAGEYHHHEDRPDGERRQRSPSLLVPIPTVNTKMNMPTNSTASFRWSSRLTGPSSSATGLASTPHPTVPPTGQSDDTLLVP
jgi:hypothetical protein